MKDEQTAAQSALGKAMFKVNVATDSFSDLISQHASAFTASQLAYLTERRNALRDQLNWIESFYEKKFINPTEYFK